MDENDLRDFFKHLPLSMINYFESVDSTNTIALQMAEQGAADFSLVIANQQTAGRGRFKRRWITSPDAALAFSLVLRPTALEVEHLGRFSPLGALAVCDSLAPLGLNAEIKWPNDVLLAGRKICGILSESVWLGNQMQAVVVGIGVNVASDSIPPANQLLFPATCVEDELQHAVNRYHLLAEILQALIQRRAQLCQNEFINAWQERLAFRGKWVRLALDENDKGFAGKVIGVDAQGSLQLQGHDGTINHIAVGEIHLRPGSSDENDSLGGCAC